MDMSEQQTVTLWFDADYQSVSKKQMKEEIVECMARKGVDPVDLRRIGFRFQPGSVRVTMTMTASVMADIKAHVTPSDSIELGYQGFGSEDAMRDARKGKGKGR